MDYCVKVMLLGMAKILIAEDDEPMARIYEKAFKLSGHTVEIASDGEEMLRKLKEGPRKPDAILLDMVMPKINGLEVVQAIKMGDEWEEYRDIPIVIITNLPRLSGSEDIKKSVELGVVEYLLKSMYDPVAVVKKVEENITKAKESRK
jgi:CheY-like chemotaxis protein